MSAVVVGMTHARANILRQCYESLLDSQLVKAVDDSDVEIGHNDTAVGDEDVDDSAASSGSDNDFDQSSDEFESHRHNNLRNYRNSPIHSTFNTGKGGSKKRRWQASTSSINRRTLNINKRFMAVNQSSVDNHSDDDSIKNGSSNSNKRAVGHRSTRTPTPNNYGLLR